MRAPPKSAGQRAVGFCMMLALVSLCAAACGGALSATRTSATVTTLPNPISVLGSRPGSSYPLLGPVNRVLVEQVRPGAAAPEMAKDDSLPLSAVEIAYRQFGSGPDLLLVSGEHSSMTSWDPKVLVELASHFRITEFDFPGVGYSQPDSRFSSVGDLADLTAGLIWSLGLSQPTVLGWGLGGTIALSLVERHPGIVVHLVLAEASAGGPGAARPSRAVQDVFDSPFATTIELSRIYFPSSADAARISWISDVESVVADTITAGAIERLGEFTAASYRSDLIVAQLKRITIPVLLFVGEEDEVVPPSNTGLIDKSLRRATVVELPGAGYAAIFQDATTFESDLVAFTSR